MMNKDTKTLYDFIPNYSKSSTTRASVGAYSTYEDFDRLVLSLEKVKKIFK